RHTRFSRDWSSDVCSSDLPIRPMPTNPTVSALVIRRSNGVEIDAFLGQRLGGVAERVDAERNAGVDHRVQQELADLERRDAVREDRKSVVQGKGGDGGGVR